MIKPTIQDAINAQINAELWSAYLYLSMGMYFESQGLSGIANWFRIQFKEEQAHAEIFINYLIQRGGRVELKAIDAVPTTWESVSDAFAHTLAHEQKVTALINDLYALAEAEHDYATRGRLDWFISEQVEEEETAQGIIDRLKLIEGDGSAMFMLNQEFASRVYNVPSPLAAKA